MMMKITILLSITAVFFMYSCSGSDSGKTYSLKTGEYNYVISDSSGYSLVEGVMKIDSIKKELFPGSNEVTGSFTVTKTNKDTSYHGLTSLSANELKGYYNDSARTININTNPQIADANVFINANVSSKELKGSWYYSTFRGQNKEGGLFTAVKKK
jgi:hypothetical protein